MSLNIKIIVFLVFAISLSSLVFGEIIINEVMYDPYESESYNEWIEIYNNGTENVSLENWTICGDDILLGYLDHASGQIYKNTTYIIPSESYAIITDGGTSGTDAYLNFNITNESLTFHISLASLCNNGLSNSGETITLYNVTHNFSFTYSVIAETNYSAEFVNGTWTESLENGGTPGRENTGVINVSEDNSTTSDSNYEVDVEINISETNLSLGTPLNISGTLSSTFPEEKEARLTVKIGRGKDSGYDYDWYLSDELGFNITANKTFEEIFGSNLSWNDTSDLIKGNYKVLATVYYDLNNDSKYKYDSIEFYVAGLDDLGEENMLIISYPETMRFGDIEKIDLVLNSNNLKSENAAFVAYIYSPKWASIDLDGNTLRTRPYEANTALKFDNISRGKEYYISLPLLSKRNCEDDFEEGVYSVRVRIYDGDEDILEEEFNITLSGRNDAMCPVEKTIEKSCKSTAVAQSSINDDNSSFSFDSVKFEIISPENAKKQFEINITAKNPTDEEKTFSIWSYVYSASTSLMERTANKKEITLKPNQSISFKLQNEITKEVKNLDYKLMVKVNSSNRKSEKSFSKPITLENGRLKEFMIKSFYTRTKNFEKKISLFANCEGESLTLTLNSFYNEQEKPCEKNAYFEVEIDKGYNVFFLELKDNATLLDLKKLILFANETSVKEVDKVENYRQEKDSLLLKEEESEGKNLITGQAVKTDKTIYESSSVKAKRFINYIIPAIIIVGAYLLFVRKK